MGNTDCTSNNHTRDNIGNLIFYPARNRPWDLKAGCTMKAGVQKPLEHRGRHDDIIMMHEQTHYLRERTGYANLLHDMVCLNHIVNEMTLFTIFYSRRRTLPYD